MLAGCEMEPNKVTPKVTVRPVTPPLFPPPNKPTLGAEETEFIIHLQDRSGLRIRWPILAGEPKR